MTRANAVDYLSLKNTRNNEVKYYLEFVREKSLASGTRDEESLSARLDNLCLKIRQIENSMNEALNETTKCLSFKINQLMIITVIVVSFHLLVIIYWSVSSEIYYLLCNLLQPILVYCSSTCK
ncbi:unnamed protein product [Heterobilharzia americana]|nr:unnamed protein product [Heterobilharzia americana]